MVPTRMAHRLLLAVAAFMLMTALLPPRTWADGDPTGAKTGTIADVPAAKAGQPTLAEVADAVGHSRVALNIVWTLITGFLVMFMQAGFAMVETGFTRAKNVAHTMGMNFLVYRHWLHRLLDLRICPDVRRRRRSSRPSVAPRALPTNSRSPSLARPSAFSATPASSSTTLCTTWAIYTLFLFQMVFMDTTVTIPTGAMAERWQFLPFIIYGFFLSMVVYPLFGNWVWGGGWLSTARGELRSGAWTRRFRGIVGRPYGRRRGRPGRRDRARPAHREV